jgi:ATP-binding protein involved in chromosome partitioning
MEPSRDEILKALEQVIDPELRRPVTELDMVRDVRIDGGDIAVTIALTVAGCPLRSSFEQQVAEALAPIEGVERVSLDFDVMSPEEKAALTTKLRGGVTERTKGISLDRNTRVIAVASGKGGVGKSSLTVNLAAALSAQGQRVGILDADVYGHSIPHLLGIRQRPVVVDRMIVPPVKYLGAGQQPEGSGPFDPHGRPGEPVRPDGDTASGVALKLMSIGFFLDDNSPVMWRGPMLHRALEQFLSDVHWGELDTLVVDMPPGTGDVSISLGQLLPRAEAVIVTTPQPLAQEIAARAALMAQKTNMRLLGVVENMSGEVFGSGGGQELADDLHVPLLGSIPLDPSLREAGDAGEPLVIANPDTPAATAIAEVAEAIAEARREQGVGFVKSLPVLS